MRIQRGTADSRIMQKINFLKYRLRRRVSVGRRLHGSVSLKARSRPRMAAWAVAASDPGHHAIVMNAVWKFQSVDWRQECKIGTVRR
jgi:hypothetical protein